MPCLIQLKPNCQHDLIATMKIAISSTKSPSYAVSATGGKKLTELELESLPVWDGMIVADGKLYLTTLNGEIICLSEKG